jgi:hypothetical protein
MKLIEIPYDYGKVIDYILPNHTFRVIYPNKIQNMFHLISNSIDKMEKYHCIELVLQRISEFKQ